MTPSAALPPLDKESLAALEAVGRSWQECVPRRAVWEQALPVNRHLQFEDPVISGAGRFVQIRSSWATRDGGDEIEEIEATEKGSEEQAPTGRRALRLFGRSLIGPPLRSTALAQERLGRLLALGVLSPDALSSVAYGPEAMLAVLLLAGSGQLKLSLPIGAALAALMLSVGLGYRQVIKAYPHGGGSYVIAKDSLAPRWGLIAGAGLILDYILTVAVSVASGVEAVTSAIPSLHSDRVLIGLLVIVVLAAGNLRGVRDAGVFAIPTYLFILAVGVIVIAGLVKAAETGFEPVPPAPHSAVEAVGVLLVLRAFSSGATAMTGIEVISNAVPVFRPPEAPHARQTLTVMLGLLVSMFIGVVLVAHFDGAAPGGTQTLLSRVAHASVGSGVAYGFVQFATTAVLLVAANSAFNGFPRLLYFMARDSYAPRLFLRLGDRLAFNNGIMVLAIPAAIVFVAFGGNTAPLIPLFAIGVFIAFTLAQSGMVAHWLRHREQGWRRGLATNLIGAVLCAAVVVIAAITKFTAGAWVVVVLVPVIVVASERIHRHYEMARRALMPYPPDSGPPPVRITPSLTSYVPSLQPPEAQESPSEVHSFAVVPVAVFDLAALRALAYAASLAQPVLALHVSPTEEEAERFRRQWLVWGDHLPLELVVSPFRATVAPLAHYVAALHRQRPDLTLTLVIPEIVVARPWQRILHSRTEARLLRALRPYEGIVMTTVPFHLPP